MESPEKNMKFLLEAVDLMPKLSPKLVCHYLSHCRKYEGVNDLKLPSNLIRKSSICKFCGNKWSKGDFCSGLFPRKRAGKRMRKLMRKAEESPYLLRNCEKKMLSMVDKFKQNRLVLVCKQCHKKTVIPMQVPKVPCEPKHSTDEVATATLSQKKRKKKKKAKDIFCGLNPAVLAHLKSSDQVTVQPKSSVAVNKATNKSVKEKLNVSMNESVVGKKKQLKTGQPLLRDKVIHVLQSEARRRILSSSSFKNFITPVP